MKYWIPLSAVALWLAACGGGGASSGQIPMPQVSPSPQALLPLVVGNTWGYACYLGTPAPNASTFPKTNTVLGTVMVNGTLTYEYAVQMPSSPTQSTTQIQLLANDGRQNTVLYGYMANPTASPQPVASPTIIIASNPGANGSVFDYPGENGGIVSRFFCCTGPTHTTVFGTFTVEEYFDGGHTLQAATDGFGYAPGKGSMEEDYNFNDPATRLDCLITSTPPPG